MTTLTDKAIIDRIICPKCNHLIDSRFHRYECKQTGGWEKPNGTEMSRKRRKQMNSNSEKPAPFVGSGELLARELCRNFLMGYEAGALNAAGWKRSTKNEMDFLVNEQYSKYMDDAKKIAG